MAPRGLGKGLASLIPGSENVQNTENSTNKNSKVNSEVKEVIKEVVKEVKVNEPLMIKLREIDPNKEQPREIFDEVALQELADSIKQYGLLQPIVVKKLGKRYQIIAGERRWRASKLVGLKEVPVILKDISEQEVTEIALIENIQRENLNPVEEAKAYKRLSEEFGLKQDEIAKKVSKDRSSVANAMRLLKLSDEILNMVSEGSLSTGHAKVLLSIDDVEKQKIAADKIIAEGMSVRQAEKLVKELLTEKEVKEKPELSNVNEYEKIRERLCEKLGTKVDLKRKSENKGKIEIEYYSFEELERILEAMGTF